MEEGEEGDQQPSSWMTEEGEEGKTENYITKRYVTRLYYIEEVCHEVVLQRGCHEVVIQRGGM